MRNLDVTTLRSLVAVADLGGVTRAAGFLHLTQSAVSMQLKRLEDLLDLNLIDRSGRGVSLTASGEQLLAYARRMVALNDEVIKKLTDQRYEGEVSLGVPHDVVYPVIPQVLKQLHAAFPRVKVRLEASYTRTLKEQFQNGECDVILTTETGLDQGGETLADTELCWVGASGGVAWRQRPLRLAFCRYCTFRPLALARLDEAGMPWELAVETESDRTIEAAVSADLAVHAMIEGTQPAFFELIDHGGTLPALPRQLINMFAPAAGKDEITDTLTQLLRTGFAAMHKTR